MSEKIHPSAIVDKNAKLARDVEIGPYAIIEKDVKLGKNVKVYPHAYICRFTEIGDGTQVHMGAVVGHLPQDLTFKDEKSFTKIGKRNVIREYATIHRGNKENTYTVLGDDNYIMALSHIGHNCVLGNNVILANGALLAGHIEIEDSVFVSGNVVVHQFCKIGKLSLIGGFSGVNKDVPPYMILRGPSTIRGLNLIGLRRFGAKKEVIKELKNAFQLLYRSEINTNQALEKILEGKPSTEALHLVDFIKKSKRGICKYRYNLKDQGEEADYFE